MTVARRAIPTIPTTGRLLAWLSIAIGLLTALTPLLPAVPANGPFSTARLTYFVLLGLTTTVAAIDGLRSSPKGFYALWFAYAVQLVAYTSESLSFNFMGPFSLSFGFGEYDPPSFVNINLLAVVACFVALRSARSVARSGASAEAIGV